MGNCPHVEVWSREIRRAAGSLRNGESPRAIKVSYCTHPQSPVPLESAQRSLGEGPMLTCGGYVRRCPLPEAMRPRPEPRAPLLSNTAAPTPLDLQISNAGQAERK